MVGKQKASKGRRLRVHYQLTRNEESLVKSLSKTLGQEMKDSFLGALFVLVSLWSFIAWEVAWG